MALLARREEILRARARQSIHEPSWDAKKTYPDVPKVEICQLAEVLKISKTVIALLIGRLKQQTLQAGQVLQDLCGETQAFKHVTNM